MLIRPQLTTLTTPPAPSTSVESTPPRALLSGPYTKTVGEPSENICLGAPESECYFGRSGSGTTYCHNFTWALRCPNQAPRLLAGSQSPQWCVKVYNGDTADINWAPIASGGGTITCDVDLVVADSSGRASSSATTTVTVKCAAVLYVLRAGQLSDRLCAGQ